MQPLKPINRLTESLAKLPSVGKKSAERMAYALLDKSDEDIQEFSAALLDLKQSIKKCPRCGLLTDGDTCPICDDPNRDRSKLLVVSYYKDALAIENTEGYNGPRLLPWALYQNSTLRFRYPRRKRHSDCRD